MKVNNRTKLGWVIRFIISFGLLAYILTLLPLEELGKALIDARLSDVLICIVLMFLMRFCNAYRMSLITRQQGLSLSAWEIFKIGLIVAFFGLFLPGTIAGGPIRWYMLSRKDSKPVETLASMAFARLSDTIVLVGMGTIFAGLATLSTRQPLVIGILGGVLLGLMVLYLAVLNSWMTRQSIAVAKAVGLYRFERVGKAIDRFTVSMERYHRLTVGLRLAIWGTSLLIQILGVSAYFFAGRAVGIELSLADYVWIRSFVLILGMLPISIAGIGVRDSALIVLLAPFGVSAAEAVAVSFVLLSRQIVLGVIGGLLAATKNHLRRTDERAALS